MKETKTKTRYKNYARMRTIFLVKLLLLQQLFHFASNYIVNLLCIGVENERTTWRMREDATKLLYAEYLHEILILFPLGRARAHMSNMYSLIGNLVGYAVSIC